jgi:hypothetical protein
MCLWFIHYERNRQHWDKTHNGQARDTCSSETRNIMDKPETHALLGQDRKWTNQRHRQYWRKTLGLTLSQCFLSLVCPFCVLSQYYLSFGFVHSVSCLNTACVHGLSTICLVSILHVSSLLGQDRKWTNQRHRQYWRKTLGLTRDTYSIKTRHILYTPETHVVMFWDKTHNGQTRDTCNIERRHLMDKSKTHAVLRQDI